MRTDDIIKPEDADSRRRLLRVPINPELLLASFRHRGAFRVTKGFPETTRVVQISFSHDEGCFYLYLRDPAFPEVPEGAVIPKSVVEFEAINQ